MKQTEDEDDKDGDERESKKRIEEE